MVVHHRLEQIYNHLYPSSSNTSNNNTISANDESVMMMNFTSASTNSSTTERVIYHKLDQYPIVVLYLNDGPVNALSAGFIKAIQTNIEKANNDDSVKGIVIASKLKGFFVAGADITEIAKGQGKTVQTSDAQIQFLQNGNGLMNLIENSPKNKPTIACIDGVALGGGLELAMGCNGRVCTESSVLGLPETNLGIIPGFGGCNRLPRLIGTKKAIEMMLTAQPIKGKQAFELGLVDKLEKDSSKLLNSAIELALDMVNGKKSIKKSLLYSKILLEEGNSVEIVNQIESKLDPIQQKLPHLRALLRVVRESVSFISNGYYGLDCEGKEFLKIANQPVSRGMVHYFLATKATSKLPKHLTSGQSSSSSPQKIKYLGVIGGGTMGANIVVNALENGIQVILKEINDGAAQAGLDRVRKVFQSKVDRKRMTKEQFDKIMSQVKAQTTFENFDKLDMVIEAVLEIVELKQNIFADLEKHCSPNCILATNTSTIDLNRISDKMTNKKNRERVIGLHYFTPAHVMPLLEIIRTEHNTSNVLNASLSFAKQVKKTPVVVLNAVGFAVNRIFWPYGIAAQYLMERGVHPYQLDKAINQSAMRVGFFNMADMSGVDVLNYASGSIGGAYKDRARGSPLLKLMIDAKRLGEKTSLGFYKYDSTGKRSQDVEGLEVLLAQARKLAGNPSKLNYSDKEIAEACLFNAVNEACRVIEEKLVFRVSDIDVASVMGMGFMHFYGGLMKWADEYGAKYIHDQLTKFYQDSNGEIVSFKPCKYLTECATNNLSLYSADAQLMK